MDLQATDSESRFSTYLEGLVNVMGHADRAGPLRDYCTGLMLPCERKSVEPMAAATAPARTAAQHQSLLHFVGKGAWSDEKVLAKVREMVLPSIERQGPIEAWIIDDTGFPKQGRHSVGVARQYCGQLGKQDNCQVAVSLSLANRHASLPVAWRLYLPQEWAQDCARRKKAHVPEDIQFQTKPEIALALLDHARELGIRHAAVTADGDYGDNPNFLAGLELRKQRYVVAVRCDFSVAQGQFAPVQRADALIAAQGKRRWRTVRWREGSQGELRAKVVALRCWRVTADGRRRIGWLIGEDASDGKRRYCWSNFGRHTPLVRIVEYAHRRHWVERFHEEAKELLGWDQYQGRLWTGFHRNSVLVMLAYSFLVWQEFKQRQEVRRRGRPRRPFSPSGGPQAHAPAGGPSSHRRLAAA